VLPSARAVTSAEITTPRSWARLSSAKIPASLQRNRESEMSRFAPRMRSRTASRHSAGDATTRSGTCLAIKSRSWGGAWLHAPCAHAAVDQRLLHPVARGNGIEVLEVRPRLLAVSGIQIRQRIVERQDLR